MTIRELFDYIMLVKPHTFSDSVQLLWLNELEGRVQLDIYLMAPVEVKSYELPADEDAELLVSVPHTGIYRYWMEAMLDLERGEYQKYQNSMEAFNAAWNEYACWFAETQGTEGDGVSHGFYLSAYGIAVKHGYQGSEEEWLESLKGDPGRPFTYEDFTEEQLAALKDGVVQDALDEANAAAEAAAKSAQTAEDKANAIAGLKAEAETLAAGETATARAELKDGVYLLTLGIPVGKDGATGPAGKDGYTPVKGIDYFDGQPGKDGATGPAGADGYSPTVNVTAIAGGHRVSITDVNGAKTFDVMDGEDGEGGGGGRGEKGATFYPYVDANGNLSWTNDGGLSNPETVNIKGPAGKDGATGPAGKDGYTPVKGVDYFDGQPGKDGAAGPAGADGQPGKDARINGVNTLTLTTDEYLSATQTGSTLKLGLKSAPSSLGAASYALMASGWAKDADDLYAQTIAVTGVTADPEQVIVVDVQQTGTDTAADTEALAAWAGEEGSGPASWYVSQGSGSLTFHAKEAPTVNIPLNIAVGVS